MVEEIKTQIEVKIREHTKNKDGTLRKMRPIQYDDLFSIRVSSELLKKIKSTKGWQQWARDLLEKEINLLLDKPKEI